MLNAGKYNKKISIYQVEKIEDAIGFKNEKKFFFLLLGQMLKQLKVLH